MNGANNILTEQVLRPVARQVLQAVSGGGGFSSPEYQAVWDSFTTKPSAAVADADNTMVKTLVDAELWSTKLDIFDHLAQEVNSDGESLKNWINPGTFDPALVNAPVHVSLEGFTSDGSTSYINLNWNANSDGVNYVLNSASIGCYIRTNVNETKRDVGVYDGTNWLVMMTRFSDNFLIRLNSADQDGAANTDSRGMNIATKNNPTNAQGYRNKSQLFDNTHNSSVIPNFDVYGLAYNNNGSPGDFSTKQESLIFGGAGLVQADVNIITDAFETRMDTLGKGVA